MAKPALAVAGWSPEEAARYELAIIKGLAGDKRAQRVYYHKVRVVAEARARAQQQQVQLSGADTKAAASAGGRSEGAVRPTDVAAPRARRRKSEAQRLKSYQKLQHKHLQPAHRRCEAAATKAGGSPPKILARVLACCGRFYELLLPEGAARMERLRQREEETQSAAVADSGLDAMRAAMEAVTEAATAQQQQPETMDVGDDGASGGGGAPRPVFQFGAWPGDKPRELAPATRASCADFEFRPGWSAMTKKGGRA